MDGRGFTLALRVSVLEVAFTPALSFPSHARRRAASSARRGPAPAARPARIRVGPAIIAFYRPWKYKIGCVRSQVRIRDPTSPTDSKVSESARHLDQGPGPGRPGEPGHCPLAAPSHPRPDITQAADSDPIIIARARSPTRAVGRSPAPNLEGLWAPGRRCAAAHYDSDALPSRRTQPRQAAASESFDCSRTQAATGPARSALRRPAARSGAWADRSALGGRPRVRPLERNFPGKIHFLGRA